MLEDTIAATKNSATKPERHFHFNHVMQHSIALFQLNRLLQHDVLKQLTHHHHAWIKQTYLVATSICARCLLIWPMTPLDTRTRV